MREFKGRHGEVSANDSPAPAPKKTPRKRATPAKKSKKKVESDEDDEDTVESPLSKKVKHKKEEGDEDVKMGKAEGERDHRYVMAVFEPGICY
jgi:hypothetical protein